MGLGLSFCAMFWLVGTAFVSKPQSILEETIRGQSEPSPIPLRPASARLLFKCLEAPSRPIDRAPNRRTSDGRKKAQEAQIRTKPLEAPAVGAQSCCALEIDRAQPPLARAWIGLGLSFCLMSGLVGTAFVSILRQFTEAKPRSDQGRVRLETGLRTQAGPSPRLISPVRGQCSPSPCDPLALPFPSLFFPS